MFFFPNFKPIVLAIHGSASTAKQWRGLERDLAGVANFIAPDLPGYGSAKSDISDRVKALSRHVGASVCRIHILAHSFGGAVALKFANAHPERVASVTLYDPIATLDGGGLSPELNKIWRTCRRGPDANLMQAFLTFWAGPGVWSALTNEQRTRLLGHAAGLRRDMKEVSEGQWTLNQTPYRGPLTILRGGNSPRGTAAMARAVTARHPQAVSRTLPGLDHLAPLTEPARVNALFRDALAASDDDFERTAPPTAALAA